MGVKGIIAGRNTKPAPTYSIAADNYSPNEGDTVTFTITTTNVDSGTTFYWWTTNYGGITAADFVEGYYDGTISVNFGSATFSLTLKNDFLTEGTESFAINIGLSYGTALASTSTINVQDTSQTIPPGYKSVLPYGSLTFNGGGDSSMFYADSTSFYTGAGDGSGNGDFTFEAWVFLNPGRNEIGIFGLGPYAPTFTPEGQRTLQLLTLFITGGTTALLRSQGSEVFDITGTWPGMGQWVWVTVSRSSGTLRMFLNGQYQGSHSSTANYNDGRLYLGADSNLAQAGYNPDGCMTDIRFSVGANLNLYPENIAYLPPTEALPILSSTKLKLSVQSSATRLSNSQSITMIETGATHAFSSKYPYLAPLLWLDGTSASANTASGVWLDQGSSGNHATLYASPIYVSNQDGGFLKFTSASSQYAQGAYLGAHDFITVNIWARLNAWPPTSGGGYGCLFTDIYNGTNVAGSIGHNINGSGSGLLRSGYFSSGSWHTAGNGITPVIGAWQMLTLSIGDNHDGNRNVKFYLNGTLVDSSQQNYPTNSDAIGYRVSRKWDSGDYLDTDIGTVQYFNDGLSATAVTTIYNNSYNRFIKTRSYDWPSGSNRYMTVDDNISDWAMVDTWTIQFWSKAAVASTNTTIYTVMCQAPASASIDILYTDGHLYLGNALYQTIPEPPPGVWTHVAIVNDNTTVKVYYNGVLQDTLAGNYQLSDSTNPLVIGRRGSGDYQYFYGQLAGIQIQPHALYTAPFNPFSLLGGYNINDHLSLWPTDANPFLDMRGHTVTAHNNLGLNAYVPSIRPLESFSTSSTPISSGYFHVGNANVRVGSSNFNGQTRTSFIELNGTYIASSVSVGVGNLMTRGHTVAVINPVTGTANSITTYDTYDTSGGWAAVEQMVTDINNNVDPTMVLAIASWDATSKRANLTAILSEFGGTIVDEWSAARYSHYFVGIRRDLTLGNY